MNVYRFAIAAMAIVAIAIVEIIAIVYQVDGRLLGLAFAAIAGLGGYELAKRKQP